MSNFDVVSVVKLRKSETSRAFFDENWFHVASLKVLHTEEAHLSTFRTPAYQKSSPFPRFSLLPYQKSSPLAFFRPFAYQKSSPLPYCITLQSPIQHEIRP
jgi:hypothetical protein